MYNQKLVKIAWPMGVPDRGVCLDSARGLSSSSLPRGSRVRRLVVVSPCSRCGFFAACRSRMVLCTTRQYQQAPKRGRLRELHCTLACDWATGNTRSWPKKASTTDIQSGPQPSLGKNLDGARRLSRLTQFPRFTHKPRRPGDYRLHHVTTSAVSFTSRSTSSSRKALSAKKGRAARSEQHPQNDTFPWCSASDKSSCSGSFV